MRVLVSLFLLVVGSLSLLAQGLFPGPDPMSLTAEQLVSTAPEGPERFGGLGAEFDQVGNRLRPLGNITYLIPVSPILDWKTRGVGNDLGKESLIYYKPILPIYQNPYDLRPAVDVLRKIGPYDFLRPELSFTTQHETNIQLSTGNVPVPDIS